MKQVIILASLWLILSTSAMAQAVPQKSPTIGASLQAADSMPSVEQILDKYVRAIGGKAAIEKVTSRFAEGTFSIPAAGVSGQMKSYRKSPGKRMVTVSIADLGTLRNGFDGTVAWEQDPETGKLTEKNGKELSALKRDADFYRDIKLREIYPQMTLKGIEKVGSVETYLIEATPAGASTEKLYFDTETGLLIRRDSKEFSGTPVRETYGDYQEVDGIKLPFSVRRSTPAMTYIIKITEVKQNVTIDDAQFNKPALR
jgi:outer membrane lipoprotein-sorting protein